MSNLKRCRLNYLVNTSDVRNMCSILFYFYFLIFVAASRFSQ